MKILEETDQRFKDIEKKIGLFVFIAIVGVIALIAFIERDVFVPKTKIYFVSDSGQGINEGTLVKLKGFNIGKVKRLALDDRARVQVEMSIYSRYMKWIKTDSKALLVKEGLIGDSIIEIEPGSAKAAPIIEKGVIPFEREKGLSGIAEELKDEIIPVLQDAKQITGYLNDPQGDVKLMLKNMAVLSKEILTTRQNIDTLLRSTDTLVKNTDKNVAGTITKIDAVLDTTKQSMTNMDGIIKKIDKDLPPMIEKVDKSLDNVRKITEDLKKATEQSAPQVPALIEKSSDVAEGSKEIVDSVKKMWPVRSFIKKPEERPLKTDSYE